MCEEQKKAWEIRLIWIRNYKKVLKRDTRYAIRDTNIMELIFWLSLVVLAYTYFGYPFLLWMGSKLFSKPVRKEQISPSVTFVVVAYNEEGYIGKKIDNILSLDYPKDKLEIIIGSDGSTDRTNEILDTKSPRQQVTKSHVKYRVIISKERRGKVSLLNEIVPQAKGEIIVFSDARQMFDVSALRELVSNFADEKVGCVSGELVFDDEEKSGVAGGVGFYWRYEKWMRKLESNIHSMVGATGAIYAIRKGLFTPPPPNTILDDVFIPLKVVQRRFRAIFDPQAKAFDKVASTSREEFTRKVRTLAGNFQLFVLCRELFNPFKSPVAFQFFSHKFLRAVAFLFLMSLFISNLFLMDKFPYSITMVAQVIFYTTAIIGWMLEKASVKSRLCSIPYVFCVLNFAALKGFLNFLAGKYSVKWEKAVR